MENILAQTLSETTQRYLKQKMSNNDQDLVQTMDLRLMCEQVTTELHSLEQDAAFDYLKVEQEIEQLNQQVEESDNILAELQDILLGFKDDLGQIKGEMLTLSQQSQAVNQRIANRKQLQSCLDEFTASAVLEPSLVLTICNGDIEDNYMQAVQKVVDKLMYLKQGHQHSQSAAQQLEPELQRLNKKACQRIRQLLLDKIMLLKRPKTNIQILQNNLLLKYAHFTKYLKEHFLETYVEICNFYSETLSKLYLQNMKSYIQDISKLGEELYLKTDRVISDNPQHLRLTPSTLYCIGQRARILQDQSPPVVYQVLYQNRQKCTQEQLFRSINQLLLCTVVSEYVFTLEFFNLKKEHNKIIFQGIFKASLNYLIEHLKSLVNNSHDLIGMLLMVLLNQQNKKELNSKNIDVLDFYLEQTNMILWPRFTQVFQLQINTLQQINPKQFKNTEKTIGIKELHTRYANLQVAFYTLYQHFQDNNMLLSRINKLKKEYLNIIEQQQPTNCNHLTYQSTIYYIIYSHMAREYQPECQQADHTEFTNDIQHMEQMCCLQVEQLVQELLQSHFQSLASFVKQYTDDHQEHNYINQQNIQQNTNNNQQPNHQLVLNIIMQLNESYTYKLQQMKHSIHLHFNPHPTLYKQVIKKLVNHILALYNAFYKYVKNHSQSELSKMIPVHQVMKETKNIYDYDHI